VVATGSRQVATEGAEPSRAQRRRSLVEEEADMKKEVDTGVWWRKKMTARGEETPVVRLP
jgi:hypothetical protein